MSRLNNFTVNIEALTKSVKQKGFGLTLILDDTKAHPYTLYGDISEVVLDFAVGTDVYKIASRLFGQSPRPAQVAIAGVVGGALTEGLNDIVNTNNDWFALVCTNNESASIMELSEWIDPQNKIYAVTTQNLEDFELLESENTFIGYHDDSEAYLAEGLMAYMLVREIGGVTAKFKAINGVGEANITNTELAALHNANGFTYIRDMGVLQVTNSKVSSGEYLDVVLGKYFIKFRMEEELMSLAVNTGKIPYSNEGIASIISVVSNVLKQATNQNILLKDEDGKGVYNITYLDRSEVPKNEIANRKYNFVEWSATLAGAIESAEINGKLEL